MLADRTDRLTRIDARLGALAAMLADARSKNYATVETMLRKRVDMVLDSRLAETAER